MAAGKFVGRVGRLAVVPGVGFVAYQGTAAAYALPTESLFVLDLPLRDRDS